MRRMSGLSNGHEGRGRVTIRQIAEIAGVSIATVSRVVNGRGDVSDETRELVQKVVREHGYSVNRTARGLSGGRTGFVGVTVPKDRPRLLLVHPLRRRRGLVRAGHAHRPLPDGARARARGVAARPADARHDRRRPAHPSGGDERRAGEPRQPRLPLRRRRPAPPAERAHPGGLRGRTARVRTRRSDTFSISGTGASARIMGPIDWLAPQERRDGYHAALASAGIMPDPALEIASDFQVDGRRRGGRQAPRPCRAADRDLRVQRQPRDRRDAGGARTRPPDPGGPVDRRLRRPRVDAATSHRSSRPFASRSRRWAAWR